MATKKTPKARRSHVYYYKGDDFTFGPFTARSDNEAATMIEGKPSTMSDLYWSVIRGEGYARVMKDEDILWQVTPSGMILYSYAKTDAPMVKYYKTPSEAVGSFFDTTLGRMGIKERLRSKAGFVPIEEAKKGSMVELEVGVPWPSSSNKQKVSGRVVQIKKDGTVTVDVERSSSNPHGHPNEDVSYIDIKL